MIYNNYRKLSVFAGIMLFLTFVPAVLNAEEIPANDRLGFFTDFGLGGGTYFTFSPLLSAPESHFTMGIESKIGGHINNNFSVFLLSHINIISLDTAAQFTNWIFSEYDLRVLLTIFIPFSLFLDSQIFVGPGFAYHTGLKAPSFYVEGGLGYYSFQSVALSEYTLGLGFFTGVGVDITNDISFGLRTLWAPSFAHAEWTPSPNDYLSIMAFIYIF